MKQVKKMSKEISREDSGEINTDIISLDVTIKNNTIHKVKVKK